MSKKVDIVKHILVPKHIILSEKEKSALLENLNISAFQLPIIKIKDPIAKAINAKAEDIIKIERKGPSGKYIYFRRVAE